MTVPEFPPVSLLPQADLHFLNTLAIPAKTAFLARVTSASELIETLGWWKQQHKLTKYKLPVMPLGGGSNVVFADNYPGLVIRIGISGKEVIREDDDFVWLKVGAGEEWHELVEYCMNFHYWGLENLALIPGSVGAAPVQNIGAYGVEVCDYLEELSAVEIASGLSVTFERDACGFGYRDSIFKNRFKDRYIITSVTFKLRKHPQLVCDYPALQQYFKRSGKAIETPLQIFHAVCDIRRSKLPDPIQLPNAGSFFQNPLVEQREFGALQQHFPGIIGYPTEDGRVKLAAGWLIDQAGWRGYQEGAVGVHAEQALVLINPGHASGKVLLALAEKMRANIAATYQVKLEIEPRVIDLTVGPE